MSNSMGTVLAVGLGLAALVWLVSSIPSINVAPVGVPR
jgi:hypothetical protein